MKSIYDFTREKLEEFFIGQNEKKFKATQVYEWLYKKRISSFEEMQNISKTTIQLLKENFLIDKLNLLASQSDVDVDKYLFELKDQNKIEAVLMHHDYGYSVCVSSQVGCDMRCAFCASGSRGVVRSLTADEIVAEYMAGRRLGEITNIVVMGMGEPFANYDETIRALKLINAGKGPNLGARHITLSTCGVVPGFAKLAAEGIQFELSVSLHAPNDELRSQLMPVNNRWHIDELLETCAAYTNKTKRIITFEYTVIKGVNDSRACAEELARQVRRVPMAKVNLIPLSPVSHRPDFKTPDDQTMLMFLDVLMKNHVQTMLRRSRGKDANAACGQLRLRHLEG